MELEMYPELSPLLLQPHKHILVHEWAKICYWGWNNPWNISEPVGCFIIRFKLQLTQHCVHLSFWVLLYRENFHVSFRMDMMGERIIRMSYFRKLAACVVGMYGWFLVCYETHRVVSATNSVFQLLDCYHKASLGLGAASLTVRC